MIEKTRLSRKSAVALSAELGEVVVKLRALEAKYNLEDIAIDGHVDGLGVRLLAALRPYAQDPEVSANALRSGLSLSFAPLSSQRMFVKQTSDEPDAGSLKPAEWVSSASSVDSAGIWSRSTTAEVVTTAPATRRLHVMPKFCKTERWTFIVDHQCNQKILDLRKALSHRMKLPLGKLRLATQPKDSVPTILSDADLAQHATLLLVSNVSLSLDTTSSIAAVEERRLSRDQAIGLQLEILAALRVAEEEDNHPISRGGLKEAQASILPKYGFAFNPSGLAAMLKAFDHYIADMEIACAGDSINEKLGLQPQVYNLEVHGQGQTSRTC